MLIYALKGILGVYDWIVMRLWCLFSRRCLFWKKKEKRVANPRDLKTIDLVQKAYTFIVSSAYATKQPL